MRRLLIIYFVLVTSFVSLSGRPVAAQVMERKEVTAAMMEEKQGTGAAAQNEATEAAEKSEYLLPYAGILPDHPLYFLKILRDRIIDFLIVDSLKKAEFTLLQGDKRLSAGIALVEKGKPELAESTVSKGHNYLSRSLDSYNKAKSEGKDVMGFTVKLTSALEKHETTLFDLANKTSGGVKDRFTQMANDVAKYRESLQN